MWKTMGRKFPEEILHRGEGNSQHDLKNGRKLNKKVGFLNWKLGTKSKLKMNINYSRYEGDWPLLNPSLLILKLKVCHNS